MIHGDMFSKLKSVFSPCINMLGSTGQIHFPFMYQPTLLLSLLGRKATRTSHGEVSGCILAQSPCTETYGAHGKSGPLLLAAPGCRYSSDPSQHPSLHSLQLLHGFTGCVCSVSSLPSAALLSQHCVPRLPAQHRDGV